MDLVFTIRVLTLVGVSGCVGYLCVSGRLERFFLSLVGVKLCSSTFERTHAETLLFVEFRVAL